MTDNDSLILSILIPVYNEAENIAALHTQIMQHVNSICGSEIIFIDDGSKDDTLERIKALKRNHANVHYIGLIEGTLVTERFEGGIGLLLW